MTPDISHDTWDSGPSGAPSSGYFSQSDVDHAIAASPAPHTTDQPGQSFQSQLATGAEEGKNFLRRVSVAAMGGGTSRRESMTDIRAISPDLALTGNIISATFNIPHSLKYRKGSDWV